MTTRERPGPREPPVHGGSPTPGSPERAAVQSMFDRIAPRYDLLNRLLSVGIDRRWRRAAVDFLELGASGRILDLCSGTADLLIEGLSRHPGHAGLGVDLSREMLLRGGGKLKGRGLEPRSALAQGDVARLPVPRGAFSGALMAFGIRNVTGAERALLEVRRALKPGGRLVVLEFSMPRGLRGGLYRFYFRRVLPAIGGLVSGDAGAYSYLPSSVERFASPDELAGLMRQAGFGNVVSRALTGGVAYLHRGEVAPGPGGGEEGG